MVSFHIHFHSNNEYSIQFSLMSLSSYSGVFPVHQNEYCIYEPFEAKCFGDEMIAITSALYGFMGTGKCVTYDFGKGYYNLHELSLN